MKPAIGFATIGLLAGCGAQNESICEAPPAADLATSREACIHRAAYKYARSTGTNSELAKAARTECESAILESAQGMTDLKKKMLDRNGTQYTRQDYEEGLDQAYKYSKKSGEEEALRRIIQAKAGNCDPPE